MSDTTKREACWVWPPESCCRRCRGDGGWYVRLGAVDWDWVTCQQCRGTGAGGTNGEQAETANPPRGEFTYEPFDRFPSADSKGEV